MIEMREIQDEIVQVLEPLRTGGFGRKNRNVHKAADMVGMQLTEYFHKKAKETFAPKIIRHDHLVQIRLDPHVIPGALVDGEITYSRNPRQNLIELHIEKKWFTEAVRGDKRKLTIIMKKIGQIFAHEFLHWNQMHRDIILTPEGGSSLLISPDKNVQESEEDGLDLVSYLSDKLEITAWANDAARSLMRSYKGDATKVKKMLTDISEYPKLERRSSSFSNYVWCVKRSDRLNADATWKRYIKRLCSFLDEYDD